MVTAGSRYVRGTLQKERRRRKTKNYKDYNGTPRPLSNHLIMPARLSSWLQCDRLGFLPSNTLMKLWKITTLQMKFRDPRSSCFQPLPLLSFQREEPAQVSPVAPSELREKSSWNIYENSERRLSLSLYVYITRNHRRKLIQASDSLCRLCARIS